MNLFEIANNKVKDSIVTERIWKAYLGERIFDIFKNSKNTEFVFKNCKRKC